MIVSDFSDVIVFICMGNSTTNRNTSSGDVKNNRNYSANSA